MHKFLWKLYWTKLKVLSNGHKSSYFANFSSLKINQIEKYLIKVAQITQIVWPQGWEIFKHSIYMQQQVICIIYTITPFGVMCSSFFSNSNSTLFSENLWDFNIFEIHVFIYAVWITHILKVRFNYFHNACPQLNNMNIFFAIAQRLSVRVRSGLRGDQIIWPFPRNSLLFRKLTSAISTLCWGITMHKYTLCPPQKTFRVVHVIT